MTSSLRMTSSQIGQVPSPARRRLRPIAVVAPLLAVVVALAAPRGVDDAVVTGVSGHEGACSGSLAGVDAGGPPAGTPGEQHWRALPDGRRTDAGVSQLAFIRDRVAHREGEAAVAWVVELVHPGADDLPHPFASRNATSNFTRRCARPGSQFTFCYASLRFSWTAASSRSTVVRKQKMPKPSHGAGSPCEAGLVVATC